MEVTAVSASPAPRSVVVNDVIDNARFNSFFGTSFAICLATFICDGFDINVFGLVVPVLMKDMKLSPAQVGLLGSYGMAGMIFGAFLFGMLADRIGRKRTVIFGTLIYCVFTGIVGFTRTPFEFGICRFVAGFGLAGLVPVLIATVSEYSPRRIRATLITFLTSGMAFGTVIAVLVSMALLVQYGWRVIFYVTFIPLILVPLQVRFLPDSMSLLMKQGKKEEIGNTLKRANPDFTPTPEDKYEFNVFNKGKASIASLFQDGFAKNTILFCVMLFVNYCFIYGFLVWLPKLMTLQGWSVSFSLWFALTYNFGFVLGIPVYGWAADKYGSKKVLIVGLVVTGVLMCLFSTLHNAVLMSFMLFITGAAQHGMQGAVSSYVSQSYPLSFRSTGMGFAWALGRFGGTMGPIVGGLLLTYKVSVPMNFVTFGCLPFVSAIAVLLTTDYTFSRKSEGAGGH